MKSKVPRRLWTALIVAVFANSIVATAARASTWARVYNTVGVDWFNDVHETPDGGLFLVLQSFSAMKLDSFDMVEWVRTYPLGFGRAGQPTSDGGYVIAGDQFPASSPTYEAGVVKLDATGAVQWHKSYGGPNYDLAYDIVEAAAGGYVVAGALDTNDPWVFKIDATGAMEWQLRFATFGFALKVENTPDGGFIVCGMLDAGFPNFDDLWLLKLDGSGAIQWQKTYDNGQDEICRSVKPTSDGGFIATSPSFGTGYWVVKLDAQGDPQWTKSYDNGGTWGDPGEIIEVAGGYVFVGLTADWDNDFHILGIDQLGAVLWQHAYGGLDDDRSWSLVGRSSGGFVVGGYSESFPGTSSVAGMLLSVDASGVIDGCALQRDPGFVATVASPIVTTLAQFDIPPTVARDEAPNSSIPSFVIAEVCPTLLSVQFDSVAARWSNSSGVVTVDFATLIEDGTTGFSLLRTQAAGGGEVEIGFMTSHGPGRYAMVDPDGRAGMRYQVIEYTVDGAGDRSEIVVARAEATGARKREARRN